jgi:hypothetical protein
MGDGIRGETKVAGRPVRGLGGQLEIECREGEKFNSKCLVLSLITYVTYNTCHYQLDSFFHIELATNTHTHTHTLFIIHFNSI